MSARKDEPQTRDRRSHMRYPISFRAVLQWDAQFAFVRVADIANGGIRLIGDDLPKLGSTVRVGARSLDEQGRVIWRTAHSCGIMFPRSIDALRVVRANCRPGMQQAMPDTPLQKVTAQAIEGSADGIFEDAESARAFFQAGIR